MQWLKADTQVIVRIGPFMDATDGVTPEEGVDLSTADQAEITKHGGGASVSISASTWNAVTGSPGWYDLTLVAGNLDTEGMLEVIVQDASLCLPVTKSFMVVAAEVYDSMVAGTDNLQVDAIEISGDATAANNAESFFDGTGYAGTNNVIPTVTTLTGHTVQTGDSFGRIGAAGAGLTALSTAAALSTHDGKLDTVDANVDTLLTRITSTIFSGITSLAEWLGAMAGRQAADATALTEIKATGAGSGTFAEDDDSLQGISEGAAGGGATAAEVWAYATRILTAGTNLNDVSAAEVNAQCDTALSDFFTSAGTLVDLIWDEATSGHAGAGTTGKALTDAGSAGDPWSTALPGAYGAGTAGNIMGVIDTNAARLTAVRAAVLTDWINGGRLDLILDAIPTTAMRGTDSAATEAKQDALITTVGTAGAGLTDLGGMSTGMKAEVNAEADTAIETYNLDHIAAADAPSAPTSGSWLGDLIEDDAGAWRFNTNALEQAPSGSGSNKYEVRGDVTQLESGEVRWCAWCEKNGQPETPTACTVKLVKCDGDGTITEYAGATETVSTGDANKVMSGEIADPGFTVGVQDYMHVTLTADTGTRIGLVPFKVPARVS